MQGIYFIDAETVPMESEFPEGTPTGEFFKKRFNHEATQILNEFISVHDLRINDPYFNEWQLKAWQKVWEKNAALCAEFCKIVSVSVGVLTATESHPQPLFYIKTITSRDEAEVLKNVATALINAKQLGGHNILEFDGPVLMRRYLTNRLPIPLILDTMFKKTWDIPFMDTMKMYSGSAWNYKISLAHLAHLLGIQSPKEKMGGSDVANLYYSQEHGQTALDQIGEYNAGDVICSARVFARMRGYKEIKDVDIYHIKPTPNEQ